MPKFLRKFATGAAVVALGFSLAPAAPAEALAPSDPVWGVTSSNKLISFGLGTPGTLTSSMAVQGLATNEKIVGVDFRPANGALYAVTNASKIYTVALNGGKATFVSTISPTLSGTTFGVDFNPVADRLRITSDLDQNLRVNVDTGIANVDGNIAYGGGTPNPVETAVAYTNPVAGATATTLYGLETGSDNLVTQNANVGTLTNVGSLGVDASAVSDLDLASDGTLLAAITLEGGTSTGLYSVNASTGAAGTPATIGGGETVAGLAIPLPSQARTYGLLSNGSIATMEGTGFARVSHVAAVTGLQAGESLVGIDVWPKTGEVIGVGSTSRIYAVDAASGAAKVIGTAPFSPALSGTSFDVDFNPVANRIRVLSDTGQNLRINPETGAAINDTAPAFVAGDANAGDTPALTAAAYTNSVKDAATTQLFAIDTGNNALVRFTDPNAGVLTTVVNITGFTSNATTGMDIASDGSAFALNTVGAVSTLYSVNATTGVATGLGAVQLPAGVTLNDIAVADPVGYSFVGSDGGVFNFGGSRFAGSTGSLTLNKPIVGMTNRTPGIGYWLAASDGGVFSFGNATFYGSLGDKKLNAPIVGIASTPTGLGYWLVASDGGVFSFGDAKFSGIASQRVV